MFPVLSLTCRRRVTAGQKDPPRSVGARQTLIYVYYIFYYLEICVAFKFIENFIEFGSDSTSRVLHTQNTQHSALSVWTSSNMKINSWTRGGHFV